MVADGGASVRRGSAGVGNPDYLPAVARVPNARPPAGSSVSISTLPRSAQPQRSFFWLPHVTNQTPNTATVRFRTELSANEAPPPHELEHS
ncbi:protein of unknown function [Methylorubrum extorquens DM4]|uniref:Uncharacterized protein n=1 Tax=Methylorubrum extorquens (strain DSM 6343 / CIP 106787 / DM4) TaxID=661410 RepID=C7CCH4_METED|nr:protein of unknown function [Methylorubrum extorquens DM4]